MRQGDVAFTVGLIGLFIGAMVMAVAVWFGRLPEDRCAETCFPFAYDAIDGECYCARRDGSMMRAEGGGKR